MYYPKSQIKTNLYTNGDEFVIELTNDPYVGYYYLTSSGIAYSGKTPDDRPNQRLTKISPTLSNKLASSNSNTVTFAFTDDANVTNKVTFPNYASTLEYASLKNIDIYNPPIKLLPYYSPTLPTQQDYQNGEFKRYFCKKTNQLLYIEINQEQFDKLVGKDPQIEFSLYQPFYIDWQLTGNKEQVAKVNRNSTELIVFKNKFLGLNEYLRFDWTKYYQ